MLVLSRKLGEKVVTSNGISVTVSEFHGKRVRLAFEAPDDVRILRAELASRLEQQPSIDGHEVGKHNRLADTELFNYRAHGSHAPQSITVSSPSRLPPKTEQTATVKIITFTAGQVRLENVLATELEGLTEELGERHLLLDFTNVEYITSFDLGTLVILHRKMKASGGRLTLFNLNLQVFEVFKVTHIDTLIGICR